MTSNTKKQPPVIELSDVMLAEILSILSDVEEEANGKQRRLIGELRQKLEQCKTSSASNKILVDSELVKTLLRCLSEGFSCARLLAIFLTDG